MAAKETKYKILPRFVGSVVHIELDGEVKSIQLDDKTEQETLAKLYAKGFEGVEK